MGRRQERECPLVVYSGRVCDMMIGGRARTRTDRDRWWWKAKRDPEKEREGRKGTRRVEGPEVDRRRKGRACGDACKGRSQWTMRGGERGHPRDYSDFKGLVFGICRRHKRTATLNWMSFEFIDFTIAVAVPRVRRYPTPSPPTTPYTSLSYTDTTESGRFLRRPRSVRPPLPAFASGRTAGGSPVKFPKVRAGGLFHLHNAHTLGLPIRPSYRFSLPHNVLHAYT